MLRSRAQHSWIAVPAAMSHPAGKPRRGAMAGPTSRFVSVDNSGAGLKTRLLDTSGRSASAAPDQRGDAHRHDDAGGGADPSTLAPPLSHKVIQLYSIQGMPRGAIVKFGENWNSLFYAVRERSSSFVCICC